MQPARPSNPLTTTVTDRCGERSAACRAAQSPAPPAPRIRRSVSRMSMARSAATIAPGRVRAQSAEAPSAGGRLGQVVEALAGPAEAHAGLTSAEPSKRDPWVSKNVTLSVPGSVTLNAKPNDGFSPIEVEVSNSAMSRPR